MHFTTRARVGVDLVDTEVFRRRFEGSDDVLGEVFSRTELDYCRAQARPWAHLAARFAAKEATLKALSTGLTGAMAWRDVEVTRDAAGAPQLAFHGTVAAALGREKLTESSVSLSHTDTHAIAFVVLFPT